MARVRSPALQRWWCSPGDTLCPPGKRAGQPDVFPAAAAASKPSRTGRRTDRSQLSKDRWVAHHAAKHDFTFTVLSDPGNHITRQLGIVNPPQGEDARAAAAAIGVDLAAANADATDDVAMPTAVIIDAEGIIRSIDVHPDYSIRTEPKVILDALRQVLN